MAAIGDMLPIAMAIALSPLPIVAAVLIVGSPNGRVAGPVFGLGWLIGLVALSVTALLLVNQIGPTSPFGHLVLNILRIIVGLLLLWAAINKWRNRPQDGEEPPVPKWLAAFNQISTVRAFRMGGMLAAANPKHIGLVLAAMSSLLYEPTQPLDVIIGIAVLVVMSSSAVGAVIIGHAAGGQKAATHLESIKQFMLRNNTVIVMIVFAVLGMSVLGAGISGLGE